MMHHPNMHHQPMSGHPPQHLGGHQAMPTHHQMPPHPMHRENRHVQMPRLPMGPSQNAHSGMGPVGGHGQALGGMGSAMGVPPHHAATQRPSHPIRAMPHHALQPHHHPGPPNGMKGMRRGYPMGGGYPGAGVLPYTQPPAPPAHLAHPSARSVTLPVTLPSVPAVEAIPAVSAATAPVLAAGALGARGEGGAAEAGDAAAEVGEAEAARPSTAPALANSKEKTPMCLVNELARYNKIKHQYRLTSETGPPHKKVFTVTLRLGDTEEYTAEGSSIKRAQHAAAGAALAQTAFPAPPPRQQPAHTHTHHRHNAGAVMPTVELNALAMKLCEPAVYTAMPPAPPPRARLRPAPPYRPQPSFVHAAYTQRMVSPGVVYRVRVCVGGRAWLGEGATPQGARHDAAARALHDLRPAPSLPVAPGQVATAACSPVTAAAVAVTSADTHSPENGTDLLSSEVKSPVSMVHELALKKNLSVTFTVKSERGPPHMRVFITLCTVGELETEGEGNGKKVSKRCAAERMLDEMRRRWPPALLRARLAPNAKRKLLPTKKKTRNLIKESAEPPGGGGGGGEGAESADNPISRLAMARHAARARSPQYRVVEERGMARRREFVVQCDAPPHSARGLGPNKKTAKRRAAHNVLLAMETGAAGGDAAAPAPGPAGDPPSATAVAAVAAVNKPSGDANRKEGEAEARQPVPGVLLMDYHQRQPQHTNNTGVSEGGNSATPGAKDQLMYLAQLLGFSVQFSDFPKRNHGEYLSLVSLSTEPPVMCHGGGASTAHSHEQCSRAALRALAQMGLDSPPDHLQSVTSAVSSVGGVVAAGGVGALGGAGALGGVGAVGGAGATAVVSGAGE